MYTSRYSLLLIIALTALITACNNDSNKNTSPEIDTAVTEEKVVADFKKYSASDFLKQPVFSALLSTMMRLRY